MQETVFRLIWNNFRKEEGKTEKMSASKAAAVKAKIAHQKREFVEDLQEFLQIGNKEMDKFIEAVQRDANVGYVACETPIPEAAAYAVEPRKGGDVTHKVSPRLARHTYMTKIAELPNHEEIYQYILTL